MLTLPDGIDKGVVTASIEAECAELELLYPDYETMRRQIGLWSTRRSPIWEKLLASTQFNYDPIENYNRMEEWTDTSTQNENRNDKVEGTTSAESKADITGNTTSNSTNSVQGFDGNDWAPHDKNETNSDTLTTNEASSSGSSIQTTAAQRVTDDNSHRQGRVHGNIGVTTTQTMIRQEREIVNFDIYQVIVQDFQEAFCLMVY